MLTTEPARNGTVDPGAIRKAMTARYPWLPDEKATDGTLFDRMPAELAEETEPEPAEVPTFTLHELGTVTVEGYAITLGNAHICKTPDRATAEVLMAALALLDMRIESLTLGERLGRILLAHLGYPETILARLALNQTLADALDESKR